MYKIVRMYHSSDPKAPRKGPRTISKGHTLEEAQAHCRRDHTSGTKKIGGFVYRFFDGYEET